MRKKMTLATFRRIAQAEEVMMRTLMPRCAANSPAPVNRYFDNTPFAARRVLKATPRLMASLQQISTQH